MTEIIEGDLLLEPIDKAGPFRTRAHHAHIPFQHIKRLRYLIQPRDAKQPTDSRHPVVTLRRPGRPGLTFRIATHGAELVNDERPSIQTDPDLPEEHGPRRLELDGDRNQQE